MIWQQKKILSVLISIIIIGCAPSHLRQKVDYSKRSAKLRISRERLYQIESQNHSMLARKLLYQVRYYLGTPYKFGGDSRRGMDCSGLVSTIFRESFKIELPHNAHQIYQISQKISPAEIKMGDLVFFGNGKMSHVGIYLQNNYFVHASASYGVIISDLDSDYFQSQLAAAGRIVGLNMAVVTKMKFYLSKMESIPEVE